MDNKATKSKDNLRAAGKKRLEEFRQKRLQKGGGAAKAIAGEASASLLEDEQAVDNDPSSATARSSSDKDDHASVETNNYSAEVHVEPEAEATAEINDGHQIQDCNTVPDLSEEETLRDAFIQPDNEKHAIADELDACLLELRLSKEHVEDLEGRLSGEIMAVKEEKDRVLAEFHKALAENNHLASQLEGFKSQIQSAHAERGEIEGQLHASNLQLEKCSFERAKLVSSLTSCQEQLKETQGHESDLESRKQQLADEIDKLREEKVKVECDKQKLTEKLDEVQESRGAMVEELQKRLEAANEDKSALSMDLDVLNKKLEAVSHERSHSEQKLEFNETKQAEVSLKLSSLEDRLRKFELENQQLASELGQYRQTVVEVESQNAQLTADIEELKTELLRTSDEKSQFVCHHERVLAELQVLKTGRVQLESELTSVMKLSQEVEQGLRHQISRSEEEKINVIVEFENLVSQLEKLLEDDADVAGDIDFGSCKPFFPERIITRFVAILHILQKKTEEKVNFLAKLKDYEKCIGEKEEVVQKLAEAEEWKEKLEAEKRVAESMSNEELQRLTTANLQLMSGMALMKDQLEEMSREKEGLADEVKWQLQSRDQEIDRVKEENADLLNQLAELSQRLQELDGMNRAFQLDIQTLRSGIQHAEDEKIQQLEAAKQQQEKLSEFDSLKDQLRKLVEERETFGAENGMLRNQVEVLHAKLDKEREYLKDQSVVINDFEHQLEALKDENLNLKSGCLDHENTVQKLKDQLHDLESQLARLNQEVTIGDAEQHQDKRVADGENMLQSELDVALQRIRELEENGENHLSTLDRLEAYVASQQQQLNQKIGVLAVENESMLEEAKRQCLRLEATVETLQKEISEMDVLNHRVGGLIEKAITALVPDQLFNAYDDMEGCVAAGLSILIGKIKETENQLHRLGAQVSELDKALVTVNLEGQMEKEAALQREHDILDELAKARSHEQQLQLELEQTNQKLLSTKEKLSLAVNKGKGLVQQRDALKQTVGELEAASLMHEEDLRERDIALQEVRAQLKVLEMSSQALESEMASTKDLNKLLQERNASIETVAQMIDGTCSTSEFLAMDLEGKVKWLIEEYVEAQRKALAAEQMSTKTVEALTEEVKVFQEKVELLNDEITAGKQEKYDILAKLENFTSQHSRVQEMFAQERVSLQDEMTSMQARMDEYVMTGSKLRSILERMSKFLIDVMDEDTPNVAGPNDVLAQLDLCIDTLMSKWKASHQHNKDLMKQISILASEVKYLEESKLHLQEGLASKDLELNDTNGKWEEASIKMSHQADQIKELLQALESVRGSLASVTNERNACQNELYGAIKERDRLQLELTESEQRLVAVREKLGLAIKKGKGLAQQRDELKQSLTEKSSEINSLNASYKEEVQALEIALKERSLQAESLQSLVVERERNIDTQIQSLKSVAAMKQEKLDACKALLNEARNNEESLVAELAIVKRKSAEILEGKRLLEEAHREASLQLKEATAKVESLVSQLHSKTEAEDYLKNTLLSLERQKQGFQQEHYAFASLITILDDMHNLVSESLEKKMAAFTEMEILATEILVLVGGDKHQEDSLQQTQETKMIHSNKNISAESRAAENMSEMFQKGLDLIKERHERELVAFFHRVSKTKKLLNESLEGLASLKQKLLKEPEGDFRSVVERLESLEAKEQESIVLEAQLASKDRELESSFYKLQEANAEVDRVSARVEELEDLIKQNHMTMANMESSRSKAVGKLTFTLGKLSELHQQCEAMLVEIENLQTNLDKCNMEISGLNQKVDLLQKDLRDKSSNLMQLKSKLKILFAKAGGQRESVQDDESHVVVDLLDIEIQRLLCENENFGMIIQRKDEALQNLKTKLDEVATEKLQLEDTLRGNFKSGASERSAKTSVIEIEELDQHPKHVTTASTPHIRSQKKVSLPDTVTIDMNTDENRLLSDLEEKGHAFKSLGVSRIFPKAGHYFGDRIDALCLLAGKVLMRQPVARLSLIVYWIAIHIWIVFMLSMAKV